jgi:transcriptional regulator of aromatic amino acid metabolism
MQERLAELDLLRKYLEEAVEAVDKAVVLPLYANLLQSKQLASELGVSELPAANGVCSACRSAGRA